MSDKKYILTMVSMNIAENECTVHETKRSVISQIINYLKIYLEIDGKTLYEQGEIYKKAGVILSDFVPDNALQTNLFIAPADARRKKLMNVIDNMNAAYRNDVLKFGTSSTQKNWKMRSEKRSKRFTTRWDELCIVK